VTLAFSLYIKSALVASPLESAAKRVRDIIAIKRMAECPELSEIYLEPRRIELALKRLLRRGSCGVDVGCHIGSFLSLLVKMSPAGQHSAIEASIGKAELLKRKFPDVDIMAVAVGAENSMASFFEDQKRSGFSRLFKAPSEHSIRYDVQMKTLDDLLANKARIDLLKLDIEGGELSALLGARRTIETHRPVLLFECGAENVLEELSISRRELFDLISVAYGYDIFRLPDFLHDKGPVGFDEFRKCGLYPFGGFNFLALPKS
jgi:FkbM family methyltransferase